MEPGLARRLLGRLDARFVFVVGKGGVGKTTAGSAVALHLAAGGRPTHLISTDPAHSLADVFGLPAGDAIHERVCGEPLTLEAFDAAGYADTWIRDASGPVRELFETGTYLDEEDVGRFLDLALPGLDEVMAALRLGELLEAGPERIVVDTAPTGHTLRLLDAATVLRSWVRALRAMARKAAAVAGHLARRSVRLTAEDFVDGLEAGIRRFDERVLGDACFLVVSRPDDIVRDETARLERALDRRELAACARVVVGGEDGADALAVPIRGDLRGCDGLRRWGAPREQPLPAAAPGPEEEREDRPADALPDGLAALLARPLLLVAGKGGVGKSTCAAAIALAAARTRSTALLSTDPAGSLEALFGAGGPVRGDEVAPGLTAHQVDADAAFRRFVRRARDELERIVEGLGVGRAAALDREVVESLLELAPPGIDEVFALAAMMEVTGDADTVVVDVAPTGHFLRLIRMPEVALEWVHELMRVLLDYRSVAGIEKTGERLLGLAHRLKDLRARLRDPERTAAVIVTLDEPVVTAETRRLRDAVAAAGIPVGAWIHNRCPHDPEGSEGGGSALRFRAPPLARPPRGAEELRAFVSRWKRLA